MYSNEVRDDYTLADAFHALGTRLYGGDWTGYEIQAQKVVDPAPILAARGPVY